MEACKGIALGVALGLLMWLSFCGCVIVAIGT